MSKGFALVSVWDKTGLSELCREIVERGYRIIATGSTYSFLAENGINAMKVSDVTDFPEILDGRVKTLHPKIFGGILYRRDIREHKKQISDLGIKSIDIIVCNLYPFNEMLKSNLSYEEMIEYIDIGGVSLIRAGAKAGIPVLSNPGQYQEFINIPENDEFPSEYIRSTTARSFFTTYDYDRNIYNYFAEDPVLQKDYIFHKELRYGENPHQKASVYKEVNSQYSLCDAEVLQGKELSYNNYLDIDAAVSTIKDFNLKTCVIVKHGNACGLCQGENDLEVYEKALAGDTLSSFGGICAVNFKIEEELALKMKKHFFEVIIASDFSEKARLIFSKKKNLRLIIYKGFENFPAYTCLSVEGALLVQEKDKWIDDIDIKVVTKKIPDENDIDELLFAFKVVKNIKSNAIVLTKNKTLLGMGAGQPSRIDSVQIAVRKAGNESIGSYLASDAFFPFPDGIEKAFESGIKAIIQPGGSKGDEEVIKKADELGIIMVFTGKRHFRH